MSPSRAPGVGAPTTTAVIVPGALARVRASAASRFAGRSGLVVSVQGGVAVVRFGPGRGFTFPLADLYPVVAFAQGARW